MKTNGKSSRTVAAVLSTLLIILFFSTFAYLKKFVESRSTSSASDSSASSAVNSVVDTSDGILYPEMKSDLEPIAEPMNQDKLYYRSLLNSDEQQLYDFLLYYAERDDNRKIYTPDIELEKLISTMAFINMDNPQLFWLGNEENFLPKGESFWNHVSQIDYQYSRDLAVAMQNEIDAKTRTILAGVSSGQSQFDIELYLHDYLAKDCTYDETLHGANMSNLYGALVDRRPVCSGYAKAMQYLLIKEGIPCLYVTGTAKHYYFNAGHAWNIVYIDHAYYQLDVTWDDQNNGLPPLHRYFNVTTDFMTGEERTFDKDNHYRDFTLPDCKDTADNYYCKKNLSFSAYDDSCIQSLKKTIVQFSQTKTTRIELSFTNASAYHKAVDQLIEHQKIWDILDSVKRQCGHAVSDDLYHTDDEEDNLLVIDLKYT